MSKPNLTRQQKESIVLLSIGTFLEYFDLLLYMHLSSLLNDLFFPKTDPTVAWLLGAFAFSSTFMLRAVGGLIIGKLGDFAGRKVTIMITTFIMSGTCVVMGSLHTYAAIGIYASIVMIICRMLQGFSSLGEGMGALIYMQETLKSPNRYVASGIVDAASCVGSSLALAVASIALFTNFNWRFAFYMGAGLAVFGFFTD